MIHYDFHDIFTQAIKPFTLEEAVGMTRYLVGWIKENPRQVLTQSEWVCSTHHGLGRWMRNNWNLWDCSERIHNHFCDLGVDHPDEMSSLILAVYWRDKNGLPRKLDELIANVDSIDTYNPE